MILSTRNITRVRAGGGHRVLRVARRIRKERSKVKSLCRQIVRENAALREAGL